MAARQSSANKCERKGTVAAMCDRKVVGRETTGSKRYVIIIIIVYIAFWNLAFFLISIFCFFFFWMCLACHMYVNILNLLIDFASPLKQGN